MMIFFRSEYGTKSRKTRFGNIGKFGGADVGQQFGQ